MSDWQRTSCSTLGLARDFRKPNGRRRQPCDKNNKLHANKIDEPPVFYIFGSLRLETNYMISDAKATLPELRERLDKLGRYL